ncbi:hypothetical protein BP00DRAFT_448259 [Aspergillus indologenus CBS 114.80]|uniref:Uncharacterized protein n=1 Tax=Aspergillus indologenus CBS 114.80 TaxID=1450541 RepID=A0A2V5HYK9_9EURO|nr:hypothetical protein BP00DRAFT_448259 [Aspergillus indologenus CBS 114.80]
MEIYIKGVPAGCAAAAAYEILPTPANATSLEDILADFSLNLDSPRSEVMHILQPAPVARACRGALLWFRAVAAAEATPDNSLLLETDRFARWAADAMWDLSAHRAVASG